MPAPLIEFAQFAHPQRWWLRRGPPPWLLDDRGRVRAFRVSLVLGLMGTASGWLTVLAGFGLNLLEELLGSITFSEFGFLVGPGFWFAVGTLVPLSRWLGRGWILSLLAVPVSMGASYCGVATLLFVSPFMGGSPPDWVPGGKDAAGFYAGFVGAGILGVWMGHPLRPGAWFAGLSAALLAGLGCQGFFLVQPQLGSAVLPDHVASLFAAGLLYVTFQSLTAVGLGMRLWGNQHLTSGNLLFRPRSSEVKYLPGFTDRSS